MSPLGGLVPGAVKRFLGGLRFPWLFGLAVAVFLADLFIPDALPFADEILLALGSLVLARLKKRVKGGGGEEGAEAGEPPS